MSPFTEPDLTLLSDALGPLRDRERLAERLLDASRKHSHDPDAELDWDAWERPPVFHWLARHVDEDELRRVFNLGIGYVAVVADGSDEHVIGRIVRA